jgi:anti-sigma regulatory factor (Ser/Thr protein kinase)
MNSESDDPDSAPLSWRRVFPSVPRMVPVARRSAGKELSAWGVAPDDAADVVLVVSELVTNAVRHGRVRGRLVELRMTCDDEKAVTVEVSDAGDRYPPVAQEPSPQGRLEESGRGLTLVAALATEWGVRGRTVGKTVWARVLVENGQRCVTDRR